jgi:AAA+ ATPase superfamily predicted ATPase
MNPPVPFVNRTAELAALERWWGEQSRPAVVWGRRRVGKTALVEHFADGKPTVFHTGAGRGTSGELVLLGEQVAAVLPGGLRDPRTRPYADWDDALDDLAARAVDRPVLVVLDEFPELVGADPTLPGVLRAFLDRAGGRTRLRLLLCGSAVRHMQALQEEREPLYGRFDLALLVHPFAPHEAALMLPRLAPADRALAYGMAGGVPLYLTWWDQDTTVDDNLARLVCEPAARLLTEGDLVLRSDLDGGDYARQVLHAVAAGRTQYGEIKDWVRAEPLRTLERLVELRLLERVRPVGEPERTKRRSYRIADPFLAFHLGVVSRYRTEIDRGLGPSIAPVLREALDDHMGGVWEEAFRVHLRRLAVAGELGVDGAVVGVGAWWDRSGENEIDALVLAGRSARPVLAGEAKWGAVAEGARLVAALAGKVERGLGLDPAGLRYAVCVREAVVDAPPGTLVLTAADLFGA